MTSTISIQLVLTLAWLAVWFWSRRRDRQELSRLASELGACRSALHEFMQETEATFAVFSKLVNKTEPSKGARSAAPMNTPISDNSWPKAQAASAGKSLAGASARGAASKKTQVLQLADKGLAPAEIASQLAVPQGEIDLILNLNGRAARG